MVSKMGLPSASHVPFLEIKLFYNKDPTCYKMMVNVVKEDCQI